MRQAFVGLPIHFGKGIDCCCSSGIDQFRGLMLTRCCQIKRSDADEGILVLPPCLVIFQISSLVNFR